MASNYKKITAYNEEQLGLDISTRKSQVDMYSDFSHFVFEILQNADDYGAKEISFSLFQDRLVIEHNGIPFKEENVRAISYFGKGTSAESLVKTGRFGLGFKSVFSFTTTPQIHSGEESFEIYDLYRLHPIKRPKDLASEMTRILLPFNHEQNKPVYVNNVVTASRAFAEISGKLRKLDHTTLLFTRNLTKISWSVDQTSSDNFFGEYLRKDLKTIKHAGKQHERISEVVCNGEKFKYLVFSTGMLTWENSNLRAADIAFRLSENDGPAVIIAEKKPLIVLFPTCVETHVGFLINAPLRTTPNRETVSHVDEFNRFLAEKLANLLAVSLDLIAVRKLMSLSFYETLPLKVEDFPVNHLLFPLFRETVNSFNEKPLLLTNSANMAAGSSLMIAESQSLRDLFPAKILNDINGERMKPDWLTGEITPRKSTAVYDFLRYILKIPEYNFENVFRLLSEDFYEKRSDDWMIEFYLHMANNQSTLWKKTTSIARRLPFVRTADGRHVSPFKENYDPQVFLPSDCDSDLLTVKGVLLENKEVLDFFQKFGLHEADIFGEILGNILPKYADPRMRANISTAENDRDISLIAKAMTDDKKSDSKSDLALLRKLLASLFKTNSFWECSSEEELIQIFAGVAKKTVLSVLINQSNLEILRSQDFFGIKKGFRAVSGLYSLVEENSSYFKNNSQVIFVDPDYNAEAIMYFFVGRIPSLRSKKADSDGNIVISAAKPFKRGLNGFDPNAEVDGLRFALDNNLNAKTASFIWNHVAVPNNKYIRGEVETSDYKTYKVGQKELKYSNFGKLLTSFSWLPDKNNWMRRPAEISLSDLPEGFDTESDNAKALSCSLGMIADDEASMFSQLCPGDPEMQDMMKKLKQLPPGSKRDEFNKLLANLLSQAISSSSSVAPGVKMLRIQKGQPAQAPAVTAPVKNPARYKERLKQGFNQQAKDSEPQIKKGVFIKAKPEESRQARHFLYMEYRGQCQITGNTFLKASVNSNGESEYYFETVKLAEFNNDKSFDSGNLLCLSADTYAKFKYASLDQIDTFDQVIADFKTADMQTEQVKMRIRLAGEELTLTWSQRHFIRFMNIYETINPQC